MILLQEVSGTRPPIDGTRRAREEKEIEFDQRRKLQEGVSGSSTELDLKEVAH
jgi:hypothetical protein